MLILSAFYATFFGLCLCGQNQCIQHIVIEKPLYCLRPSTKTSMLHSKQADFFQKPQPPAKGNLRQIASWAEQTYKVPRIDTYIEVIRGKRTASISTMLIMGSKSASGTVIDTFLYVCDEKLPAPHWRLVFAKTGSVSMAMTLLGKVYIDLEKKTLVFTTNDEKILESIDIHKAIPTIIHFGCPYF